MKEFVERDNFANKSELIPTVDIFFHFFIFYLTRHNVSWKYSIWFLEQSLIDLFFTTLKIQFYSKFKSPKFTLWCDFPTLFLVRREAHRTKMVEFVQIISFSYLTFNFFNYKLFLDLLSMKKSILYHWGLKYKL
jgi:hypothetical protein